VIGRLAQFSKNRNRQAFLVAAVALKHVYVTRAGSELIPRQARQLACRFRKTCAKAERIGIGAAEICDYLDDPAGSSCFALPTSAPPLC
jgi:hypothetical protein